MAIVFCLSLAVVMLAILDCRRVTIRNDCNYTVWFQYQDSYYERVPINFGIHRIYGTTYAKNYALRPGINMSFSVITKKIVRYDLYISARIGCDKYENTCKTVVKANDPHTMVRMRSSDFGKYNLHWECQVNIRGGYNVPINVGPMNSESVPLLCNVTLDDCPTDENYNIGDLRVVVDNHTVGCRSACQKRQKDNIKWFGPEDNTKKCHLKDFPDLKYVEMVKRKCPGSFSMSSDVADAFNIPGKCLRNPNIPLVINFCP